MNPSTADLAQRDRSGAGARRSIVLPNNSNVILAAEQAAGLARDSASWSCRPTRFRPASRRWSPSNPSRGAEENAAEMRELLATRRHRRGDDRLARRRAERPRRSARATGSGSRSGEPVAGGADFDDVAAAVVEQAARRAARRADAADRSGRARAGRARSSVSRSGTRSSSSTSSRAGNLTTHCFCRRNRLAGAWRRPIRLLLVEDNQVFREALELLLGLQDDIEVVASVADGSAAAAARPGRTGPTSC